MGGGARRQSVGSRPTASPSAASCGSRSAARDLCGRGGSPADCVVAGMTHLLHRQAARRGAVGRQRRPEPGRYHQLLRHRRRRARGHAAGGARHRAEPGVDYERATRSTGTMPAATGRVVRAVLAKRRAGRPTSTSTSPLPARSGQRYPRRAVAALLALADALLPERQSRRSSSSPSRRRPSRSTRAAISIVLHARRTPSR